MKRTPEEEALMQRLAASKFSGEGFMGDDHRPLSEIVADDLRTLEELGLSLDEMVGALRDVFDEARGVFGAEVEVRPGVTAIAHESMGRIPSPFRGDGVFEKGDVVVTVKDTGETLVITRLGLALIEKHSFFQGNGSRYRIDPARAVSILGLGSDA
jgi:hypothetical protein